MPLTIINDSPNQGAYIGGWTIAPDGFLVLADSFQSAWEALTEHMADQGSLTDCFVDAGCRQTDFDACDSCEFVDGHGLRVTSDVVLRTIRPARGD